MPRHPRPSAPVLTALAVLVLAAPALATVTFSPSQPNVDQAVTFVVTTSLTFLDPATVTWQFGDGATASGQATVQHIYGRIGTFNVHCRYWASGFWFDEDVQVPVIENRRVTATPSNPLLNQTVAFQAYGFFSSSIRWNFGDGTEAVMGGASISHAYVQPGVFLAAARDKGGAGLVDITVAVTVAVDTSIRSITYMLSLIHI
jgi:PKD repeat protein